MNNEQSKLLKSACDKLFNNKDDFTQEEIDLFMSPYLGDWIQRDATISRQCIKSNIELKNIIEKNARRDLENDEMCIIFNYLTGANTLYQDEYLDLFHWFYFNWKTTRISIPLEIWKQNKESLTKYHSYAVMNKKNHTQMNKITSWD